MPDNNLDFLKCASLAYLCLQWYLPRMDVPYVPVSIRVALSPRHFAGENLCDFILVPSGTYTNFGTSCLNTHASRHTTYRCVFGVRRACLTHNKYEICVCVCVRSARVPRLVTQLSKKNGGPMYRQLNNFIESLLYV